MGALGQPTISVVLSNYNHARYLPEAIESVLSQSFQPVEFLIIDDCSTDNSVEIIDAYARKHPVINVVYNAVNRGGVRNVNDAIGKMIGSYCFSLAADDKLLPGFLSTAADLLSQNQSAGLCLLDYQHFWDDGRVRSRRLRLAAAPKYFDAKSAPKALKNSWPHGQSVVSVRALREFGGYPEDLKWHCDWFALWAITLRHGFCYAPVTGTAFRISDSSYSAQGRRASSQVDVLRQVLCRLSAPECSDLWRPLREANALSHFGVAVLPVLLRDSVGRKLLSLELLYRIGWQQLYSYACRLTPRAVRNAIRRRWWTP